MIALSQRSTVYTLRCPVVNLKAGKFTANVDRPI
jgi:hypothetical protein